MDDKDVNTKTVCPYCNGVVSVLDLYCPICGKKLKGDLSSSVTFLKQIWVYFVSLFLPPFGLFPAIRYLRQSDEESKKVGMVALVLTIISIVATIWFFLAIKDPFSTQLNTQLELYQGLGF